MTRTGAARLGGAAMSQARREFGEGPLARVTAFVYTMLAVEALFLVAALPSLVLLMLLEQDASNLPLAAACLIPVGPAASATVFTLFHRRADLTDLRPLTAFWRGYRANLGGVLRLWIPLLAWLAVVAVILTHRADAGIPAWWAALLVLIAVAAALWGANALIIVSLFAFRSRDVVRLALYFLWRTPRVAVTTAALLVVAVGMTLLWTEAAAVLLCPVFALSLLAAADPMITEIRERFAA
jgi:hypothetical protein